jgi:hypothetical protein
MFLMKDFVSLRVTDVVPCTAPTTLMVRWPGKSGDVDVRRAGVRLCGASPSDVIGAGDTTCGMAPFE